MLKFLSKSLGIFGYVIQYGCITHCTFEYIGDFVVCSGPSMEPTLNTDNILITERISARLNNVQRGDIIIAKSPMNPVQYICKRVVGLPGDRIALKRSFNFNPFSNNIKLKSDISTSPVIEHKSIQDDDDEEEHCKSYDFMEKFEKNRINTGEFVVPRGHVWIEGDNPDNSSDSRYYGPIPQGLIRSRAVCRLWPLSNIKMLI